MCIELYVDKVLIFSQCEDSTGNNTDASLEHVYNFTNKSTLTYDTLPSTHNASFVNISDNSYNTSNHTVYFSNLTDKFLNYTKEISNQTYITLNISNVTNMTLSNITNFHINSTMNNSNMTNDISVYRENETSILEEFTMPNTTTNRSGHLRSNSSLTKDTNDDVKRARNEIFLQIALPLFLLIIIWSIIIYLRKHKRKVHCGKTFENPYFLKDREISKTENVEHKDPDMKGQIVEHKDPDEDMETVEHKASEVHSEN